MIDEESIDDPDEVEYEFTESDDLELLELIKLGEADRAAGRTMSLEEVKRRLGFVTE